MSDFQELMSGLKAFHAEHDVDAQWAPIAGYDKTVAPLALLRGAGQMLLGVWAQGVVEDDIIPDGHFTWRSAEDSTLDSPLWFEPEQFAILQEADVPYFVER
jgi:hypothetical protein